MKLRLSLLRAALSRNPMTIVHKVSHAADGVIELPENFLTEADADRFAACYTETWTAATQGTFYEDDEPVEKIRAAFERGRKGVTTQPGR